jgi:ATP/maltotriose-dependent transcriptional regulator MalT/DNA-binding SARP family transcriptional activator
MVAVSEPRQPPPSIREARTRAGKLEPPKTPAWFVPRPSLVDLLAGATDHRLTTVIAGPGFGKSAFLAAWTACVPSAWYTLDRRDDALTTIGTGILQALWRGSGALPAELAQALDALVRSSADDRAQAAAFAAALCQALDEDVRTDLVLILDDLHEISPGSPGATLIAHLCSQAPSTLHLVLSSREEPPFPIERFRGRGEVLALEPSRLAFGAEEIAGLLRSALDEAASALAPVIHEITGGWPAGVRLAVEVLRNVPARERGRRLTALRQPGGVLFGYLAKEVFAHEPPHVRELLRRVAPLERFTADLCEALGLLSAAETIASLVRRGLFVEVHDEWFSLHSLVREFAIRTWPLEPEEARGLYRRAAEWFEGRGHAEDAMRSLAAAGDHPELARLLVRRGAMLLMAGAADAVLAAADLLPWDVRDPAVERLVGHACTMRGRLDEAVEAFRRASSDRELLPPGVAFPLVVLHVLRDELEEAVAVHERTCTDGSDPRNEARLHSWLAAVHYYRGDGNAARRVADRAWAIATGAGDPIAIRLAHLGLAVADLAEGNTATFEGHLQRALAPAERDLFQVFLIRVVRGQMLIRGGSSPQAIDELDDAIRLAELLGFPSMLAFALIHRGRAHSFLGHLDQARADHETAEAIYRRLGSRNVAYALVGRGTVHLERGDLAEARMAFEEALLHAERSKNLEALVPALYQLARALVVDDQVEAERLAAHAASCRFAPEHPRALTAGGWVALARGERDRARRAATEAAGSARERHDRFALAEALELDSLCAPSAADGRRRLEEVRAMWRELDNPIGEARVELALARTGRGPAARAGAERAERRLRRLGVRATAVGAAGLLRETGMGSGDPVTIRSLGGFEVLLDGEPVPRTAWQSKKARSVLKILIARRGRPVPRELLMETLWGGEDPAKTARRLSVALATLRNVLDPRRLHPHSHFVVADGDAVAVNLENVAVDVEAFLAAANEALARHAPTDGSAAEETVDLLAAAEELYTGDFLEEDPYEEWAVALREEARATYLAVARALARATTSAGDDDGCVRYALRVLEHDPYDEEAHLGLVSAHLRAGRLGEARRSYRTYAARMQEIDAEAAPFPPTDRRDALTPP